MSKSFKTSTQTLVRVSPQDRRAGSAGLFQRGRGGRRPARVSWQTDAASVVVFGPWLTLYSEVTPQRRERWADGHRSPQPQCRSLFQGRAQGRAGGSEPAVADILRRSPGVGAPLVSPVGDSLHRLCLPLGSGEIYHRPVGSEGPSGRGGRTGWDGRPSAAAIWRGGDGAVPSTIRWCDGGGDGGVVLLGDFEGRKADEKAPFFIETRHVTAQMIPGSGDRDSSRRRAKTCAGTSLRRIILR